MAVTTLRDQIARLVSTELNPVRRYRCLVLQTDQIDLLDRLCECLPHALVMTGKPPGVLDWEGFFDSVGPSQQTPPRRTS